MIEVFLSFVAVFYQVIYALMVSHATFLRWVCYKFMRKKSHSDLTLQQVFFVSLVSFLIYLILFISLI